jgi:serine/threonine protein kinase/tetratricopeptide (TPR) repeat protein
MKELLPFQFETLDLISESSESLVSLVRRLDTGEQFLIKSIKPSGSDSKIDAARIALYGKEVSILSSLDHPNIVKLAGTFSDGGVRALIYPYRRGKTLAKIFRMTSRFSLREALELFVQLLDALEYLQLRKIVHCDINPHNIFIDDEKGLTLLDFGLAMTEEEAKVFSGRVVGTMPYVSMEQTGFTDYKIDCRSDLFCAALILYELLSGKFPYELKNDSFEELLDLLLKTEISPISGVPEIVNAILVKALKLTPSHRYQTAAGFKHDVAAALRLLQEKEKPAGALTLGGFDSIAAITKANVFVARDRELSLLQDGLRQLHAGKGTSFLISGRSGIGKTVLVQEFKKRLDNNNELSLTAHCNRFTAAQPFSALREICADLIGKVTNLSAGEIGRFKFLLDKELKNYSGIIGETFPEFKPLFRAVLPIDKVEPEKEAERLNHVLAVLFQAVLTFKPTILFIDNIQWIDLNSFIILKNLLLQETPFMFIAAFRQGGSIRPAENANRHAGVTDASADPVTSALTDSGIFEAAGESSGTELSLFGYPIQQTGIKTHIPIRSFSRDDVRQYLLSLFDSVENADEIADNLLEKTDGTPFTLKEAIRYLVNNAIMTRGSKGWRLKQNDLPKLPANLDPVALILEKYRELSEQEKKFLSLASLIEGKFSLDLIGKFGGFDDPTSSILVNNLVNQRFIFPLLSGGFSFVHDKIKETIANSIPKEVKEGYFEKLGDVYLEMANEKNEYLFEAAECYLKCKNGAKSVETCLKAAEYAQKKVAYTIATKYLQKVIQISESNSYLSQNKINTVDIHITLGDVYMLMGKNNEALSIFKQLLGEPNKLKESIIIELKYKVGSIYHNTGEFDKSIPCLFEALAKLKIVFPKNIGVLYFSIAYEIICQLVFSPFRRKFLPQKNNSTDYLIVKILNKLSYSLYFSDMIKCIYVHFKSMNLADRLNNSFEKAEAYALHAPPCYQMMLRKRANRYLQKAWNIALATNRKDSLAFVASIKGAIFYYQADWEKSWKNLQLSISTYKSIGDISNQIVSSEHLWRINFMQGKFEDIENATLNTIDLCKHAQERHFFTSTLAAINTINIIKNKMTDQTALLAINGFLSQTTSYLSKTHVEGFLLESEILQEKFETAYLRIGKLLHLMRNKNANYEYTICLFTSYCELINLELHNRKVNSPRLSVPNKTLKRDFRKNFLIHWFSCLSFPAYWGALYRNLANYLSLKGHKRLAARYFKKAIVKHHNLDMRYEEARSIRDYGLFLDECNKPGLAKDQFEKAYRLFDTCGAKLETERLRKKVADRIAGAHGRRAVARVRERGQREPAIAGISE